MVMTRGEIVCYVAYLQRTAQKPLSETRQGAQPLGQVHEEEPVQLITSSTDEQRWPHDNLSASLQAEESQLGVIGKFSSTRITLPR